jgi:aldehyde dehydrogenase (NAD+)
VRDKPAGPRTFQAGGMTDTKDRLFIGGEWVAPATTATIDVVSPHSTRVIARVPDGSPADLDRAVAAARTAFDTGPWPRMAPGERAAVLTRLADAYERRVGELTQLISAQMGAPVAQPLQAVAAAGTWRYYAGLGDHYPWEEQRQGLSGTALVRREPAGVVAAIVPWNGPQVTAAAKLAPALLAGCTVVLKPAPETPLDSYVLAEVTTEAGVPPGVVNVVAGGRDAGEHLVGHAGVDHVAFTGSTAAGRRIGAICGGQLKRHTLELGGKSAAIICDDADLTSTMAGLRFASLVNNGQTCVAQTRILASRRRYDEVVDALVATVASMTVGDPADPATEIGPLATDAQRARVLDYLKVGRHEGATLAFHGATPPGAPGWYVAPAVFTDVDNHMRIAREEIFGPVLSVIAYDDEADAVRIANDSEYGLAGTVWTGDVERGMDIARRVRTGTYGVNTYTVEPCAPFGGMKASGVGRELGPEGLAAYLEDKTVVRTG